MFKCQQWDLFLSFIVCYSIINERRRRTHNGANRRTNLAYAIVQVPSLQATISPQMVRKVKSKSLRSFGISSEISVCAYGKMLR